VPMNEETGKEYSSNPTCPNPVKMLMNG
jgi:hypothetical protein